MVGCNRENQTLVLEKIRDYGYVTEDDLMKKGLDKESARDNLEIMRRRRWIVDIGAKNGCALHSFPLVISPPIPV